MTRDDMWRDTFATLLHITLLLPCSTFTTSPANSTSLTFSERGESFASFHPLLNTSQNQTWMLSFRTFKSNALLFYHSLDRYNRRDFPLLHDYGMYVEVKQAKLVVTYLMNEFEDHFTLSDFLNEDRWRLLHVSIYPLTHELHVSIDNKTTIHKLKSYTWGDAASILDWSNIRSTVSYGGTEYAIPFGYDTFLGCMKDLRYLSSTSLDSVTVERSAHITPGCTDMCVSDNPCLWKGRCINHYTKTLCDCHDTGHDGPLCQIPGGITMTLHGYEWLIHHLYTDPKEKVDSRKNNFTLEFKTERSDGVLIYSVGSTPFHSHVVVTLFAGAIHVSMSFGGKDMEMTVGIGLDDNSWHSLAIEHTRRKVKLTLDRVSRRHYIRGHVTYLNLDPKIHIGGGDSFVVTRGLKVTQNFAGCLRNVFINGVSVLFTQQIGNPQTRFYGSTPSYRCESLRDTPLSFPTSSSMLLIDVAPTGRVMVNLEMRTFSTDAILLFLELSTRNQLGGYNPGGFIELWISDGEILLHFVPSSSNPDHSEDLAIPEQINDGVWHSVVLILSLSQVSLTVDGLTVRSLTYTENLFSRGSLALGYGLRRYKAGYIGCMRRIVVQGRNIDPIDIVRSKSSVGVVLDGCPLVDRCGSVSVCEHGSGCVSDWYGTQCDCSKVPYEGKTCHFPMFRRSCDELYQSGWHKSGVYQIDPDGSGPLTASYVTCHMGYRVKDELYGVTEVDHNLAPNTTVRERGLPHIRKIIDYRFFNKWQLISLTQHSLHCRQHISFQCYHAPIRLGDKTIFKGANGDVIDYIGTKDTGYCSCFEDRSCAQMEACNCDSEEEGWLKDEGNNTIKHHLPVTEMVFMQEGVGQGRISLGSLQCWGSDHMTRHSPITLKSQAAYLLAPTWTEGDLTLSMRTTLTRAVILHQTSTGRHFTLKIVSANEILFDFGSERHPLKFMITSKQPINTGEWVLIQVEYDDYNVRLTVNKRREMFVLDKARIGGYDGVMYVGTSQPHVEEGRSTGFLGCIRGVVYNNKNINLVDYINEQSNLVEEGCAASCQSLPCKNGARCIERWDGYICECVNPLSHLGHNCEKNLDDDVITLNGSEHAFLIFKEKNHLSLLEEPILISFRTFQAKAQIFYGYDHLNNFIQLEVESGRELVIRFNTYNTIIVDNLKVRDLSNGEWRQVYIARGGDNSVTIKCGAFEKTVPARRVPLVEYSMQPFLYKESILPVRPNIRLEKFVYIFLGGVERSMRTARTFPNLLGCLRGVRIGQTTLHLLPAAYSYRGVSDGCVPGCVRSTCQNQGACTEMWAGGHTCDCQRSYYTGPQCTVEPSAQFNGHTVVKADVDLSIKPELQHTVSERLTFHFTTNTQSTNTKTMLVAVYSMRSRNYIVVYLSPKGDIIIETRLHSASYIVKNIGNYTDGVSHYVAYERRKDDFSLTVYPKARHSYVASFSYRYAMDYSRMARMIYPEFELETIDTIFVGGFYIYDPRLEGFSNFTGCIKDVRFYPGVTDVTFKPLKLLHARPKLPTVSVIGGRTKPCGPPTTVRAVTDAVETTTPFLMKVVTMPKWHMKPANTVVIGHPTTTTTSTTPLPNDTYIYPVRERRDYDEITIILAVALVAFFMVIAVIVTVFIMCLRRRDDDKKKLEKEQQDYFELKKPLQEEEKLTVHLASLDEFSLVSGNTPPDDHAPVMGMQSCTYRFVEPITEESNWLNPPLNHKKHRPASSISEVLEEMERRRKAKEVGVDRPDVYDYPDSERSRSQYGLNTEWDTLEKQASCNNLGDVVTTTDVCVHSEPQFNGDSGYEADSKRTDSDLLNTSKSPTELKELMHMSSLDSDVSSDASLISETGHDEIHSVDSVSVGDISVIEETRRPLDDFDDRIVIIEATPPDSNVTTPSSVKEITVPSYCAKNTTDQNNRHDSPNHRSPTHKTGKT